MKNDKQIAFTELSFQPFSRKFVTFFRYPKPISRNVWIVFCLRRIFNPRPDL